MKKPEIFPLFPTPLFTDCYGACKTEFEFIKSLEYEDQGGKNKNKRSKNTYILKEDALDKLASFIEQRLKIYSKDVLATSTKLFTTQSWASLNPPGSTHHHHIHPNSLVSGSFYLNPEKNMPPIVFHREFFPMRFSINKYNFFNSTTFSMRPEEGNLVLFPSTLRHSVELNETEADRYSISFNTFADSLGDIERLDYLT